MCTLDTLQNSPGLISGAILDEIGRLKHPLDVDAGHIVLDIPERLASDKPTGSSEQSGSLKYLSIEVVGEVGCISGLVIPIQKALVFPICIG